jgi:hypothetical protein
LDTNKAVKVVAGEVSRKVTSYALGELVIYEPHVMHLLIEAVNN